MKKTNNLMSKGILRFVIFSVLVLFTVAFLFIQGQANARDLDGDSYIPIVVNPPATPTTVPATIVVTPPLPSVAVCAPEDHNPNEWHGLYNADLNCHYEHEHKHDPNEVADIFGPAGEWFGGTSLSYPWETPNENLYKHNVYGWIVRRDIPAQGRSVWTKDFRWQFHATSAPMVKDDGTLHGGYLGRFHSFSLETQVCNAGGSCGIVRTGGWMDFGNLELKDIEDCVFLGGDPSQQEACANSGRRRIHFYFPGDGIPRKSTFFWYGRTGLIDGEVPALHPVQVALATKDGSVNIFPDDYYNPQFFCPEWDCPLNNSTIQAHVLNYAVRSKFDPDEDGIANFAGYTDRYGVTASDCAAPGLDCVPLVIEYAPVGFVAHRDDDIGIGIEGAKDFDVSPPGEWWIRLPN